MGEWRFPRRPPKSISRASQATGTGTIFPPRRTAPAWGRLSIILFIVPRKDYPLHLRTLAAIAKMFTNAEVRRQLSTAESEEEAGPGMGGLPLRSQL